MSWKKPPLADGLSTSAADEEVQLAWKRPRLALQDDKPSTAATGKSWKKLSVSSVSSSRFHAGGRGSGGANHLVWHSVSIDEPTLSLIKCEDTPMSEYKKNALDPNRIAKLSAQSCGCKASCFTNFQPNQILMICRLWHALPDDSQSHFLNAQWDGSWDGDGEGPSEVAHRTEWFFAGQRVCVTALCGLLGVGNKSLMKKVQGVVDMRQRLNSTAAMPRATVQTNLVDMFFLELYHQTAEDLPETFASQDVDAQMSMEQGFQVEGDMSLYAKQLAKVEEVFTWTPEAAIAQSIMALSVDLSTVPCRHLPPGKPMALYWQFQSWCEAAASFCGDFTAVKTPSWTTFWRAWSDKWSYVLKFRKKSQHKECTDCHVFRESIQGKRKSPAEKMELACKWREHLRAQYHDRLIYWSLRWCSRSNMNVLCIIIDSMDQCKTAWPQYPFHRKPAVLEKLTRPRVILSAVLCHGWCSNIFLTEDSLHHGASSFCELLARSFDRVAEIAERTGRPFPQHLVVQCDNTTAQNKNSVVSVFMAHLVSEGKFLTATVNFLTVGHTHEDVDHYFSVILSTVLRPHRFEVPEDLAQSLREKMRPFTLKKSEELFVEIVDHVRDFGAWLKPLGVTLSNCFVSRQGRLAAHSFVYKCRCHLFPGELGRLPADRLGTKAHEHDVFALTKGRMHGSSFHAPVLCLPRHRVVDSSLFGSPVPSSVHDLADAAGSEMKLKHLEKLANVLGALPGDYSRACNRLRDMVGWLQQGHVGSPAEHAPPLRWLGRAAPARSEISRSTNMYYEHLPDTSWQLLARFHRRPRGWKNKHAEQLNSFLFQNISQFLLGFLFSPNSVLWGVLNAF